MQETNLYTATIPHMTRGLQALKGVLGKAAAHAESKKTSWMAFESSLLNDRIVFDQFPLKQQVQIACDHAKGAAARLAEVEIPKFEDTEETFAELEARIDKTLAFVATVKPEQIIGKEDIKVTLPYFKDKYFTGYDYAFGYAMPNFYFHLVTAFDIVRKNGVAVGKADFIGGLPLQNV